MEFERLTQDRFPNTTHQVETPEGTMYVSIVENGNGKVIALDVQIGKTGSTLRAWCGGISRMMTIALEHGATIENLIEELSAHTTDSMRRGSDGVKITSGPEGIVYVLIKYKRDRYDRNIRELGVDESEYRSARLAR